MAAGPAQRSLQLLRAEGYRAEVVERWIPQTKRRRDLFGVIDIVALGEAEVIGVQSTSYSNVSARVRKIEECDALADLRKAGVRLLVHGWRKVRGRWQCRVVEVS